MFFASPNVPKTCQVRLNYRFINIWYIIYATIYWYKLWRMTVWPLLDELPVPFIRNGDVFSQNDWVPTQWHLYMYIFRYVEQYLNMTILGFHLVPLILSHSDMDKILCKIHGVHETFSRSIDFSVACGCQRCLRFNPFWYLRSYILVLLMWGKILVFCSFWDNHHRSILDLSRIWNIHHWSI